MGAERQVKLFRNGRNQAVRIPREFELPGEDAIMRKEGERLVIEPVRRAQSVRELLHEWRHEPALTADERLPEAEDRPPDPFDL